MGSSEPMSCRPQPSFQSAVSPFRIAARIAGLALATVISGPAAWAQVAGTITASGSFLPFERSFLTTVLTNNGPNDVGAVETTVTEYLLFLGRELRVDRATSTIGGVTATVAILTPFSDETTTLVRWNGVLCGTLSTCPRSVTIVAEVFPQYAAQGRAVGAQGTLSFGGNGSATGVTNAAEATVGILPDFPTAPMLSGTGSLTLAKFCGVNPSERLGGVLASGDFDGDGFADLAIGLPRRTEVSTFGAGACACSTVVPIRSPPRPSGHSSCTTACRKSSVRFRRAEASARAWRPATSTAMVLPTWPSERRSTTWAERWMRELLGCSRAAPRAFRPSVPSSSTRAGFPDQAVEPGDRFGFALAAGDVDGDGLDDLVIGVPFEDLGSGAARIVDAGVAQILHSFSRNVPFSRRVTVLGEGTRTINGLFLRQETAEANDRYGFRVAVGDLSLPAGTDEIVVASPFETIGSIASGVVDVHEMDFFGLVNVVHSDSPCDRGGCTNGMRYGDALEVADVNGDSRPDLIVGDRATVAGAAQAGTVTIFGAVPPGAGSYLTAFVLHQDAPTGTAGSPGTADLFGSALATGDFNGDGLVDLATGVPGKNTGATNDTGFVNIFHSPWSNTRSQGLQGMDQALLGDARETGDDLGTALASGDFNGDGFDDLAIGVPGEEIAGGATDQGVVQVIFGGGGN